MVGSDNTPMDECVDRHATNEGTVLPIRRRDFMKVSGAAVLGLFSSTGYAASAAGTSGKTRVTYYTAEERQAALDNIQKYDWARELKQDTVESAETFLSQYSLEDLWRYVGSQDIPRASWLAGGHAGYYPYSSDTWGVKYPADGATFAAKPGKQWTFTSGEYTLPTNDFEAYRQSGLDDRGTFDPARADDSLLVNEEHPEMGEGWGVDDGLGWVDENGDLGPAGQRWVPVAWAHHWNVVYGYREILQPLYYAYLYTQEQRYARAVSIILDRVADVYPEFSLLDTVYFDEGGYTSLNGLPNNAHGGTGRGKQIGSIWESYWVKAVLHSYDAVWPAQEGDADLVSFLHNKSEEYPGLKPKRSVTDIRNNIESGLLQEILPAFKDAQLRGNFGSHQTTLAMSAVIQDDPEGYTGDAIDFLFKAGGLKHEDNGTPWGRWYITGGDVLASLLSKFDRDGHPYEGCVHYNSLVSSAIQGVGDVLNGYDAYEGADLYQNVIFKQMFETQAPLTFLNRYVPRYGDTEGAGEPGFKYMIEVDNLVQAYETYDSAAVIDFIRAHDFIASEQANGPDEIRPTTSGREHETSGGANTASNLIGAYQAYGGDELAQWIYSRNGQSTEGIRGGIFDPSPTETKAEIERIIDAEGFLDLDSSQLAGLGFTALRAGDPANSRGVWTYYGRNAYGPDAGYGTSHTHQDTLNLGVFGYGLNLAPDLGYPEQTGDWPKRNYWTDNTISHNTVVVNARRQDKQWVSTPKHYDHTDRVQLFDVDASNVYRETDQYRRTTAQITVDKDTSYVVDFFRVAGGDEHHFSFHSTTATALTTTRLDPVQQETGTYAGSNVRKPDHGENTQYNRAVGNGFNYLFNVVRDDDPRAYFSVDWDVADYWNARDNAEGVHLRLTMLTETDEVALADGKPPQRWDNPEKFRYLIAHRSGNDLKTTFTSVIEPYEDTRAVVSISEVSVVSPDPTARAVKVELASGRTDYIASSSTPELGHVVDDTFVFRGGFAVYSEKDGHDHAYVHDGKLLIADGDLLIQRSRGRIEGTLEGFTTDLSMENELRVKLTGSGNEDIGDALSEWIYVQDTAEKRNGAYEIRGIESDGANRATLNIGAQTTVKEFKDASNPDSGYEYIPREGSPFYIPLSTTWSS